MYSVQTLPLSLIDSNVIDAVVIGAFGLQSCVVGSALIDVIAVGYGVMAAIEIGTAVAGIIIIYPDVIDVFVVDEKNERRHVVIQNSC